jgi:hypothetical protein
MAAPSGRTAIRPVPIIEQKENKKGIGNLDITGAVRRTGESRGGGEARRDFSTQGPGFRRDDGRDDLRSRAPGLGETFALSGEGGEHDRRDEAEEG